MNSLSFVFTFCFKFYRHDISSVGSIAGLIEISLESAVFLLFLVLKFSMKNFA